MPKLRVVADCDPPQTQRVLFRLQADGAPVYTVRDRDGFERIQTNSLGVALAVTRRLVVEQGEAWVCSSDDAAARVDGDGVATATPGCSWIESLAASLEASDDNDR